jgi:curved DNA-binding protein CbpA
MTDYFALFGEARRPWLDPEKLKGKYFALARAQPTDAERNEAFRVLSDPKLRLHHLLLLEGANLSAGREIPPALADLFWKSGTVLGEIDRWLLKNADATSAVARALLHGEKEDLRKRLETLEEQLKSAYQEQLRRLQAIDETWPNDPEILIQLYDSISYLSRLRAQVREKQLEL